jgi:hypothetical protein
VSAQFLFSLKSHPTQLFLMCRIFFLFREKLNLKIEMPVVSKSAALFAAFTLLESGLRRTDKTFMSQRLT